MSQKNYAEADLSTQQAEASEDARVSHPHADCRRAQGAGAQAQAGPQAPDRILSRVGLSQDLPVIPVARAAPSRVPMKRYGFPKSAHLLRTADFRKVYAEGRRRSLDWLLAFSLATGRGVSRVGFTVPAAFGPAVERNRVKRRLREAVRKNWAELGPGWDLVFHPRRAALALEFSRIEQTVRKLFQSCARECGDQGHES